MIISRLRGGLGNQLFIYAAVRRLALINDAPLKLDAVSGFKWDTKYKRKYLLHHFNIPAETASPWESFVEPGGRIRRYLLKRLNNVLPFEKRSYITEEFKNCDSRVLNFKVRHQVYMEGYWQSEKYFKDIEDVIKKDLEIIADFSPVSLSESKKILEKNSVCVGIRRFQEESGICDRPQLDIEYYLKAIEIMVQKIPDAHFFVVSEEPEWVRKNFKIQYPYTLISHKEDNERAYENLWLMSLCKHFIISQGTYHWWGAWLSKNPKKIVIAPNPEKLGMAKDFIPENWIQLDINNERL